MSKPNTIIDKDATIIYRNFSGKESEFNPAGSRNFCLLVSADIVDQLANEGWNVKWTKVKEEGDVSEPFIKVNIKFSVRPPRIWTVGTKGKTLLEEEDLYQLDGLRFQKVMLTVNPYEYKPGHVSGYVDEMYLTVEPSAFDDEYGDVPNHS